MPGNIGRRKKEERVTKKECLCERERARAGPLPLIKTTQPADLLANSLPVRTSHFAVRCQNQYTFKARCN